MMMAADYTASHPLLEKSGSSASIDTNTSAGDIHEIMRFECCFSLKEYLKASLQLSAIWGILFGLLVTFLWWIDLNVNGYCIGSFDTIPKTFKYIKFLTTPVKVIIIMFCPLIIIAPICSWSMIKETNILFWCTIAGLLDVIDRLFLYIFGHYEAQWKSYVGNIIFLSISFIVFHKFVRHRQRRSGNNDNTIMITLKITLQMILGEVIFLPYNYVFLQLYRNSTHITRLVLSCSLVAVFYVPRLIIGNVIPNIHGIYKPGESNVFAIVFLGMSTMVTRFTQAEVQDLTYFTIISLVHGICNVLDKTTTKLRTKFFNLICRRRGNQINYDCDHVTHYIAHQSLLCSITETSSVFMSNGVAFLLKYYYGKVLNTGKRYNGWYLFKEMLKRSSIAVSIELAFNIVALKAQCYHKIPVLNIWKSHWKFIVLIHLLQVIYIIAYFAYHVDLMLLGDALKNSTSNCIGLFKRL